MKEQRDDNRNLSYFGKMYKKMSKVYAEKMVKINKKTVPK